MKFAFTAEQIRLIEEFSEHGMSQRDIAQAVGTTRDIIADEMRRRGIKKPPPEPGKPTWTDERRALFRKLFEAGRTHQQIATALGTTRNASVGFARRLGFDNRRTAKPPPENAVARADVEHADEARRQQRRQAESRRRAERRAKEKATPPIVVVEPPPPPPPPPPPDVDSAGVSIWDLKSYHCRWPLEGEPNSNMLYCGKPKREPLEGNSYCPEHQDRSRGPQRSTIRPPRL